MSEYGRIVEPEPTPEEIEEARRFARALEGGEDAPRDPDLLPAAYFLQSVSEKSQAGEVGRRRLRTELVTAAHGRRRRTAWWLAAAASFLIAALGGVALWRVWTSPTRSALEARERQARLAVGAVTTASLEAESAAHRLELAYDSAWEDRLDATLESARLDSILGPPDRGGSSRVSSGSGQTAPSAHGHGGAS